ncbi:hypothetical protein [Falsiroseomonas sp. E2-1-a4]|uniref:hypothetical protein n=1 Tax=Falsiroseomonas sp. E2-1-a4 TaxID=3239299 RepID=UPI003F41200B
MVGLLLGHAAPASATREQPPEPFCEIGMFRADDAKGILVVPPGAPDWQTPHVSALHDALEPDGRAGLSTDQSLGTGVAVLEIEAFEADSLNALLDALARHPRVAGQPRGLLGFGAGSRMAAECSGPVATRALLYPGCCGLVRAAMRGGPVLLMHGTATSADEPDGCASVGRTLSAAGARVRLRTLVLSAGDVANCCAASLLGGRR